MRDLALVPAGYVFSKNGQFLVRKSAPERNGIESQYLTILADACLGMKFDPELRLFVLELRGVSRCNAKSSESHINNSKESSVFRPQKF